MSLKEDAYPVDARGIPDIRCYTDALEYYIQMYEQHLGALQGKTGEGFEIEHSHCRRVHATWGLIGKGAQAVPYALTLLKRSDPEAREDGAAILSELGRNEGVVDSLIESLNSETDSTARDSMLMALGRFKSKRAVPALAKVIRDESTDGDTRSTAVESLGRIVRKRFLKLEDPIQAALAWLNGHPEIAH